MNEKVNKFKKNLVIEKAHEYFSKYGYTGVQVDKLAKELGIGVGTIYSLFGSKEGLFIGWLFNLMEKAYEEIKEQFEIQKDPLLQCEIFAKYKLTYYEKNKTVFKDYMQNQFFLNKASRGKDNPMKKVYSLVASAIEKLTEAHCDKNNPLVKDSYHLAYLLDGIIDSFIECYTYEDEGIDLVTKTREVIRLFLNSIGINGYKYEI